jgi:hypothetical protein
MEDFTQKCLDEYKQYIAQKKEEGYLGIISLDFASLYPSLIMTYNLSPEYMLLNQADADKYRKEYPLHDIAFDFKYEDYVGEKHCKKVRGWSIRHIQAVDQTGKPIDPAANGAAQADDPQASYRAAQADDRFGLYPTILRDLFNQREEIKKELAVYKHKKEHLELKHSKHDLTTSKEYRQVSLRIKYVDTKQKALKVFMNTFYGECGNKNSPLFVLELAGGITSAGQDNLKKVKRFINSKGCRVFYGDTDSLYFEMNPDLFHDVHKAYFTEHLDKHRYGIELVEATFKHIKPLNKQVNDYLFEDNGTRYLNMAYEEVLYPAAFLARKKYYGIAHEGLVNFKPKDIFIRGFEVKKRGVSEILRILCMETMWESMDVINCKTLLQLVEAKISHMFNTQWSMRDFVATAMWKPGKMNVPVNMFQERMIKEGKRPVEPYERFEYVLCKVVDPAKLFDYRGCKIEIKKGHLMEYLDTAEEEGKVVDIQYYFENQLVGQFARLISYSSQFVVDTMDDEIDDAVLDKDVDDDATMKNAKRYIMDISKQYLTDLTKVASAYKAVYRTINKGYTKTLQNALKEFGPLCKPCDPAASSSIKQAIEHRLADVVEQWTERWEEKADIILKTMVKQTSSQAVTLAYNASPKSQYSIGKRELLASKEKVIADMCQQATEGGVEWLFQTNEETIKELASKYRKELIDPALQTMGNPQAYQGDASPTQGDYGDRLKQVEHLFEQECPTISPAQKVTMQSIQKQWNSLVAIEATIYQQNAIHRLHYEKKIKPQPKFRL